LRGFASGNELGEQDTPKSNKVTAESTGRNCHILRPENRKIDPFWCFSKFKSLTRIVMPVLGWEGHYINAQRPIAWYSTSAIDLHYQAADILNPSTWSGLSQKGTIASFRALAV
jgi:hypothetical protein